MKKQQILCLLSLQLHILCLLYMETINLTASFCSCQIFRRLRTELHRHIFFYFSPKIKSIENIKLLYYNVKLRCQIGERLCSKNIVIIIIITTVIMMSALIVFGGLLFLEFSFCYTNVLLKIQTVTFENRHDVTGIIYYKSRRTVLLHISQDVLV